MTVAESVFLYWCRRCGSWWNAEVSDEETRLLRRRQRMSPDKPGVFHHPGQPACPTCDELSTQHLPTEHPAATAAHRNPQFRDRESDAISAQHVESAIPQTEAQNGLAGASSGHVRP